MKHIKPDWTKGFLTMDMHPTLLNLLRTIVPDIIKARRQRRLDGPVQKFQKLGCCTHVIFNILILKRMCTTHDWGQNHATQPLSPSVAGVAVNLVHPGYRSGMSERAASQ